MQVSWTPDPIRVGQIAQLRIVLDTQLDTEGDYTFTLKDATDNTILFPDGTELLLHSMEHGRDFEPLVLFTQEGTKTLTAVATGFDELFDIPVLAAPTAEVPTSTVALVSPDPPPSADQILWSFIDLITNRIRFDEFHEFVEPRLTGDNGPEWYGTDAYRRLRRAAEEFVNTAADPIRAAAAADPIPTVTGELSEATARAGVARSYVSSEGSDLAQPFLRRYDSSSPSLSRRRERSRQTVDGGGGTELEFPEFPLPNVPFVELIWNYWLEEGMLVQTLNHILARFQNRRVGPGHDALARFDLNPLLPLRNLLWGWVEDERRRLTVRRRAFEYQAQYGLELLGRAVPPASQVVVRRTQFLEAFHALLHSCYGYFKERDDKTVDADAFPLLSSLREVHLVLAQGAHNQYGDLGVTARAEMLTMQYVVALPEMREFLGGPTMVPYEEPWMDRVDTVKSLNGWAEASITHFFELAVHGEKIVLSVRHGRWNESSRTREDAANWALTWRNSIQRYLHAYRTVTGVDLATGIDATMPSQLLARRLEQQVRQA